MFYKDNRKKDKLQCHCKTCNRGDNKSADNLRLLDKLWHRKKRAKNMKFYTKKTQQYDEKYPERYFARYKCKNAIASGKLLREECEYCKRIDTHAHHDDYSKPLDVRWLCPRHHKLLHLGRLQNL